MFQERHKPTKVQSWIRKIYTLAASAHQFLFLHLSIASPMELTLLSSNLFLVQAIAVMTCSGCSKFIRLNLPYFASSLFLLCNNLLISLDILQRDEFEAPVRESSVSSNICRIKHKVWCGLLICPGFCCKRAPEAKSLCSSFQTCKRRQVWGHNQLSCERQD